MNLKLKRFLASAMAFSLLVPTALMAGCSKKNKEADPDAPLAEISEDTPWYTVNKKTIGSQYSGGDIEYVYSNSVGVFNDMIAYTVEGNYKMPDDFDWETGNWDDYRISNLDLYSFDGELINSFDLSDAVESSGLSADNSYLRGFNVEGDDIKIEIGSWDERTYEDKVYTGIFDLNNGTISDVEEADSGSYDSQMGDYSNEGSTLIEGYTITKYWIYADDGNNSYILTIKDPDGDTTTLDLREEFPGVVVYDIPTFIDTGDKKVLVPASGTGMGFTYYTLDLNDMTIEELEDIGWLNSVNSLYNLKYVEGVGNVTCDQTGVMLLDFDQQETRYIFRFDYCNINRSDVANLDLVSYSEDRIVFSGTLWRGGSIYSASNDETMLVILDKADENPNAGKTVLTVAELNYLSYPIAEAICRFNDTNDEYFISIDNRYNQENFATEIDDYDNVDWTQFQLDTISSMSNQLSMDLMAGDGPDIILDGISYAQLNNSDYLMDISDCVPSSGVFLNVIDASKTGNALYQLPLTCALQGISTSADNVGNDQVGFTFDQYAEFVDDVCNGADPMQMDQSTFFVECLSNMYDLFIDEDSVHFDNEAFAALAEYTKEHVNPVIDYEGSSGIYGVGIEHEEEPATTAWISSFGDYLYQMSRNSNRKIMGFPSYDGRGPVLNIYNSVGIAAETEHPDGCKAFVDMLLSDEIQEAFATNGNTPINTDALDAQADQVIADYNRQVDDNLRWSTAAELRSYGMPFEHVDASTTSAYKDLVSSCTGISTSDAAVVSIVREEIPAYFEGQKSLDAVIDILQDRVQTFVNERG